MGVREAEAAGHSPDLRSDLWGHACIIEKVLGPPLPGTNRAVGQEQCASFSETDKDTDLDFPLPVTRVFFTLTSPCARSLVHSLERTEPLLRGGHGSTVPTPDPQNQCMFQVLTSLWASVRAQAGVS